jgi:hypothetical protein
MTRNQVQRSDDRHSNARRRYILIPSRRAIDEPQSLVLLNGCHLTADLIHRAAADLGFDQLLCSLRTLLPIQREGGLQFGEFLADQSRQMANTPTLLRLLGRQFP